MKREYMKPEVEKISFCYRDQVVAASGGENSGTSDPSTPGIGDYYGNESRGDGCKQYVLEAAGWNICNWA